jgi:recombination directionality factor gp3-like protein
MFTSIKNLSRGLAVIGYIKIGKKGELKKSINSLEFRQPKKLDHFEIVTREVDESDNFKSDAEMMKILGNKPTDIQIMFQYDQIDLNFPHFLAAYKGSKLYCRGNGDKAIRDGKEIICDPLTCPIYQRKEGDKKIQCKPQGKLYAILPQKNMIGGVFAFKTTSWESIRNIISSLELISTMTGGILAGLSLKLKLIPTRDQTPTGISVNYKVAVVYEGKPQELRMMAVDERNLRLVSTIDRKAMEDARRKDISDGVELQLEAGDTVKEFYPVAAGIDVSDPSTEEGPNKKQQSITEEKTSEEILNLGVILDESLKKPVDKPAVEALKNGTSSQIYLSGDLEMDIHGIFNKLSFSPVRQKGQIEFHKNRLSDLLTQLIQKAKEQGFEIIEAPAKVG